MNLTAGAKRANVIALITQIEEALFFVIPTDTQLYRFYTNIFRNLIGLCDGQAEQILTKYNIIARISASLEGYHSVDYQLLTLKLLRDFVN